MSSHSYMCYVRIWRLHSLTPQSRSHQTPTTYTPNKLCPLLEDSTCIFQISQNHRHNHNHPLATITSRSPLSRDPLSLSMIIHVPFLGSQFSLRLEMLIENSSQFSSWHPPQKPYLRSSIHLRRRQQPQAKAQSPSRSPRPQTVFHFFPNNPQTIDPPDTQYDSPIPDYLVL